MGVGAAGPLSAPKVPHVPEPEPGCTLCERLVDFRNASVAAEPGWFNAAVPSFGPDDASLLIVGLAPGLKGAHRTGRPFTGDYAGDLLYATLADFGFSDGTYDARADDGLTLVNCMITNAVRCVPPQNKPTAGEIAMCRPFLAARIASLPRLRTILALGRIAHDSTLRSLNLRLAAHRFAHGATHDVAAGVTLYDSFHCSRYNTNTRRLTADMFRAVFAAIRDDLSRN